MPLILRSTGTVVPPPPTPPPGSGGGSGTGDTDRWAGLQVTWTGWDGSVWELSSSDSPVWLTPEGTRGLSMPPVDRYTSEAPAVAGSRWRGYRVAGRGPGVVGHHAPGRPR